MILYVDEGKVIVNTREGTFLVPTNDQYVGRSLISYGEFSHGETLLFDNLANKNQICWDVGANIGAHTVSLAKRFKKVLAFEPQKFCYRFLVANAAINCSNVETHNVALGSETKVLYVPKFDTSGKFVNYGGVSLSHNQYEELVEVFPGDFYFDNRANFIKIDVEGMELEVLKGICITADYMPTLYLENDRKDKSEALINYLWSRDYILYWHTPYLYNPNNYNKKRDNFWPTVVSVNLLAVKNEVPESWIKELKLIKVVENIHIMNLPKVEWI